MAKKPCPALFSISDLPSKVLTEPKTITGAISIVWLDSTSVEKRLASSTSNSVQADSARPTAAYVVDLLPSP